MHPQANSIEIFSLIAGILILLAGILMFAGISKWGKQNYRISGIVLTNEGVGFILFFIGMVLILAYLIALLEPRFLSPGMSGN